MRHTVFRSLMLLAIGCTLVLSTDRDSIAGTAWRGDGQAGAAWHWQQTDKPYFVEFRSRPGYLFGHTFILYGRLDARGRPRDSRYAGIYPLDGRLGLVIGAFVPVPAFVRGVEDDVRKPSTNIFRRRLTAVQYARLTTAIHHEAESERYWNLLTYNCNDFAIAMARALDMRTPPSMLLPVHFIAGLRALNPR